MKQNHVVETERDWPAVRGEPESISLDPFAGGSFAGKPIASVPFIAANLNRSGLNWGKNNYGELDDGVLNFGFWTNFRELANSYYLNDGGDTGSTEVNINTFLEFNAAQRTLAREGIALWDDLIAISFRETSAPESDIAFGNTDTGGAQAYAYLPFGNVSDAAVEQAYGSPWEIGRLGGDVWIDGFVASNFFPTDDSFYAKTTMVHELGHSLGLSHPGNYDALDDDDGDGEPDPISYENDAFYAQDSAQYTIMSYWDAYKTGAQHIDWFNLRFGFAATPLVHDIAAIQRIYGADPTTRTGNTVYGFNSTADRAEFDFTKNAAPVVAIYDAGGVDTIDFSGWNTASTIDLNGGAFSSGGGIEEFLTLEQVNANRAAIGLPARTQAVFDFYEAIREEQELTSGLYKDNIAIAYGTVIENAVGGGGDDRLIGNAVANVLTGGAGRDVFELRSAGATGADRVADWGRGDLLATSKALADGNNDGTITWRGNTLSLDASDGDSVRLVGASGAAGLRYLGSIDGLFYYGDARVRPVAQGSQRVIEGTFGDDALAGRSSRTATDIFFFDTANPIDGLGNDRLAFTQRDLIVTTTQIADGNNDGIIAVSDGTLDLPGQGGSVAISGARFLEYDGFVEENGIRYFVYSGVNSSVGTATLDF